MNYQQRVNKVFTGDPEGLWNHADLRTVFDPPSPEWNGTTLAEKTGILKKLLESGESIQRLVLDYKRHFRDEEREVTGVTDLALAEMLEYMLSGGQPQWNRTP